MVGAVFGDEANPSSAVSAFIINGALDTSVPPAGGISGTGHAWPGGERGSRLGDDPGTAFDATEEMWAFFADHPKVR